MAVPAVRSRWALPAGASMLITAHPADWRCYQELAIGERLSWASPELIDYVAGVNGGGEQALMEQVSFSLQQDLATAIRQMPRWLQNRMSDECLGIFCMRELGSSAASDIVVTSEGELLGVFVVLDVGLLGQRTANQWASWRAGLPFAPAPGVRVQMTIAEAEQDDRVAALQFLLLHEFGHVLSARRPLMPPWWISPERLRPDAVYGFMPFSWQRCADGLLRPWPEQDFAGRAGMAFYADARLPAAALLPAYQALQNGHFVSLYAALNVYDDFAESFASYVHVCLLGKPFELQIWQDDACVLTLPPYWDSVRSMRKRHCMQQLLLA